MFLRVILGAFLAAVVMFIWGAIWWMVLPFAFYVMHPLPKGDEVARSVKETVPESGFYLHPWVDQKQHDDPATMEEFMRKHREGPLLQIVVIREGVEPMDPKIFGQGFGHYFVSALLAGILLAMAKLPSYGSRVGYVFLLGLFAALIWLLNVIWMHHPWQFPMFSAANTVTSWLLAGFVLAAVVRPTATE